MQNFDNIASDLFNKIRGRFPSVTIGNENGEITNEPTEARFFDFGYYNEGRDLGKVSINLDTDEGLVVIVGRDIVSNEEQNVQTEWYNFLKELRTFAKKRLMKFSVRDINKSNLNKRDYDFLATNRKSENPMSESRMYGTNKTSYQKIGNARLAIKHTAPIEEGENRTKKIGAIYIESADGERFKYPFIHLSGARAMARHVSEGGNAYDSFGKYISGLSEELSKLNSFKKYMNRSSVMAESLAGYMDVVSERVNEVRKTIQNLQKESHYLQAKENFVETESKEVPEDIADSWIDQLTIKQFNEELKDVFPYIYNLVGESMKPEELGPDDLLGEESASVEAEERKEKAKQESINDMLEAAINALMGQFAEGNDDDEKEAYSPGDENEEGMVSNCCGAPIMDVYDGHGRCSDCKEMASAVPESDDMPTMTIAPPDQEPMQQKPKTPIGEFILSYFDRETGKFPKGETAVLTAVQKDYGDEYVKPAAKMIKKVEAMVAQRKAEELNNSMHPETDAIKALAGV